MATTSVYAGLTIDLLMNGDSLNTILSTTKALYQTFKKGTSSYTPDWGTTPTAQQPVIFPRVHSAMEGRNIVPTDESWQYNNIPIQFNAQGVSSYPEAVIGKLQRITHEGVPALRVIGNLASDANNDSDTISFSGYAEASGQRLQVSAEITVLIEEASATLHRLFLIMTDDVIDGDEESITMVAQLYHQGILVETGVEFEFVDINGTVLRSKGTSPSFTITRAMIDSELLVIGKAYIGGAVVAEEQRQVWDSTDPFTIVISPGNRVTQSSSQDTTYSFALMNARNGNQVSGISFDLNVYKNSDKTELTTGFSKTTTTLTIPGQFILTNRSLYVRARAEVNW